VVFGRGECIGDEKEESSLPPAAAVSVAAVVDVAATVTTASSVLDERLSKLESRRTLLVTRPGRGMPPQKGFFLASFGVASAAPIFLMAS